MELTQEEREELALLADSQLLIALRKLVDRLVKDQEARVLSYALNQGPDGLVIEKARAEGANSLRLKLTVALDQIFKKELGRG
jgi:hypothetical protein